MNEGRRVVNSGGGNVGGVHHVPGRVGTPLVVILGVLREGG